MKKKTFLAIVWAMVLVLSGALPVKADNVSVQYERGKTYLENTLPPSPEPASATKYADVPFTHGLGMAELNIPIYTLKGRELTIPVSLNYCSGGIKVDEVAGVVGLGWTLEAGGCITREVMYMPDEYSNWTFYKFPDDDVLLDLESMTNTNASMAYLKQVLWRQVDAQPDRYRYNFCGYSGSFIITPDKEVIHLNNDGVQIQFNASADTFHLVGPDGTCYDFTARETGHRLQMTIGTTPMSGQQVDWDATTAWHLTTVTSRTGLETATLYYADAGTWDRDTHLTSRSWAIRNPLNPQYPTGSPTASFSTVESSYDPLVLTAISLGGETVSFSYATAGGYGNRKDSQNTGAQNFPKRLSGISVQGQGISAFASWVVTTAFSQDNRVILTGLQEYRGSDLNDRWTFSYIQHGGTSRYSQDWYGYFNNETGRNSLCPYSASLSYGTISLSLDHGTPDPDYADDMMLSVVNHDGAITEFEYEGNAIPKSSNMGELTYIGVRVKKITVKDGATTVHVRSFTYAQPSATSGRIPSTGLYTRVSLTRELEQVGELIPYTVDVWGYTLHETPVLEGPSLQETRVVYGLVTEDVSAPNMISTSARTKYYYDTQRAADSWNSTYSNRFPSSLVTVYSDANTTNFVDQQYSLPFTGEPGLLTRKEEYKYENGRHTLVASEDISYTGRIGQALFAGYTVHQVNYGINAAGGQISYSDLYHYPVHMVHYSKGRPTSKVHVEYHSAGNDTLRTYFQYASYGRPASVSIEEAGDIRELHYIYPDSRTGDTACAELTLQNAIVEPVVKDYSHYRLEVVPGVHPIGDPTGIVMERVLKSVISEESGYEHYTVNGESVLLPSGREEYRDGTLSWSEQFLTYDKLGRPTSVKAQGKPNTVILWSYGGRFPVAVIENATMSDVASAYTGGATALNTLTEASSPSSTQLTRVNALRGSLSTAHVTTYTFDPDLGVMTSVKDPAGITVTYEYDDAGRLTAVMDKNGKQLEGYEYDLLDMDEDGLRSATHKTFRTNTGSVYARDVRYWNSLGLVQEDIALGASGSGTDLVYAYQGDFLLHDDVRCWLPYQVSSTGGDFQSGAAAAAATYHGNNKAYSYKGYELSSRDRLTSTAVPGYQGLHEDVTSENVLSSFPKLEWADAGGVAVLGTYASHEVVKQTLTDADGRVKVSYTDHLGRLLATGMNASADTVTYRIYDKHDQLCAVAGAGIALTDTLNMWRYAYDAKGRLLSKGVPGCARESYSYDNEDRVIAIHRPDGVITNTYDAFGRILTVSHTPTGGSAMLMEEHTYDVAPTAAKSLMSSAGQGYSWTGPVKGLELYSRKVELNGAGGSTGYAQTAMRYDEFGRLSCRVTKYPDNGILTELFTYTFPGEVATRTTRYKRGTSTDELTETLSYDIRGRLSGVSSSLKVAGTTVGTDNTEYTYDDLGRLSETESTATGGITLTTTDSFAPQGWLTGRTTTVGTAAVYTETLSYDNATVLSNATPSYTGHITRKSQTWGPSGSPLAEEYAYDIQGYLADTWNSDAHSSYEYDKRGNRLSTTRVKSNYPHPMTSVTYEYEGDRLVSRSLFLNEYQSFTYDNLGRMVLDTVIHFSLAPGNLPNITAIAYNPLDLPENICLNDTLKVKYLYLSDGMKTSAQHSDGSGLVYRGPFVYGRSAGGALTFGSAAFACGRITSSGVQYHVTDHLGSVVAVVDGSDGTVLESGKYADYGTRTDIVPAGTVTASTNRWHFSGKEDQSVDFSLAYVDFGARHYSPALGRWLVPDPAGEEYYDLSPYAYCANNPMNLVDVDGRMLDDYLFNAFGQYIGVIETDAEDRILLQTGGGNIPIILADPVEYSKNIGEHTKLITPSHDSIHQMIEASGAMDLCNHGLVQGVRYLAENSDYSKNSGLLDFVGNPDYGIIDDSNHLYVTFNEAYGYVAHDAHNFGNYLWGVASHELGVPLWIARVGAHVNNFRDPHYKHTLDSKDDQFSIKVGYHWKK